MRARVLVHRRDAHQAGDGQAEFLPRGADEGMALNVRRGMLAAP
jgi:hypothetical protein